MLMIFIGVMHLWYDNHYDNALLVDYYYYYVTMATTLSPSLSGEQVQQEWTSPFQGGGVYSQDSAAPKYSPSLWYLGDAPSREQEEGLDSDHGAHDFGNTQGVRARTGWVSGWVSVWVSEWVSGWVSEWVSECGNEWERVRVICCQANVRAFWECLWCSLLTSLY